MPQNATSAAMVMAGGWRKVLAKSKSPTLRSKDHVGTPSHRIHLGPPVHQNESGTISFQTQVYSFNSLQQSSGIEP